ncbi:helix-turn-helix domain-containing protein [Terriglobus roseus]|uniref:Helix-turn-helix domain-containing protein n=1 Tax=Terriglobus roseus TaxID=392734 RepID=A0A1G7GDL3_9BACT|nr:helix-turn-helix domain-containing protein [Terriglobus roseus]SDE86175.1 hypothetical protein SAMN05444167_0658 [Terriglobus roseus]
MSKSDDSGRLRALFDLTDVPSVVYADGPDFVERGRRKASGNYLRKEIILALAKRANSDGTNAYPSINTLVEATQKARSSVQLAISDLERLGFLTIHSKQGARVRTDHGFGRTNLYDLNLSLILERHRELKSKSRGAFDSANGDGPIYPTRSPDFDMRDRPIVAEGSPDFDRRSPDPVGHNRPYDRPSIPPKKEPTGVASNTTAISSSLPLEQSEGQERTHRMVHGLAKTGLGEAKAVAMELAYVSNNTVAFTDREKRRIGTLLSEGYTQDEIVSAFRIFLEGKDKDNLKDMGFAARNFVETADQLVYTARRKKQERAEEQARVDAGRQRFLEEGQRGMEEHQRRRAAEEAQVEEVLSAD